MHRFQRSLYHNCVEKKRGYTEWHDNIACGKEHRTCCRVKFADFLPQENISTSWTQFQIDGHCGYPSANVVRLILLLRNWTVAKELAATEGLLMSLAKTGDPTKYSPGVQRRTARTIPRTTPAKSYSYTQVCLVLPS